MIVFTSRLSKKDGFATHASMLPSFVSLMLSISIINTGSINNNQEIGELSTPESRFVLHTIKQPEQSSSPITFTYFSTVDLPKIKERSQSEQIRKAELEREQEKAKQDEIQRVLQEKKRINDEINKIKLRQEQEAKAREEEAKKQKALEEKARRDKALAEALKAPTSSDQDYITMIRVECVRVGCDADQLIRVMYCESGGRANAYNTSSGASGLFQHLPQFWASRARTYGVDGASIWDPKAQITVTAGMFSQGLSNHWVCK